MKEFIPDYCTSEHFRFIETSLKQHAEEVLTYFFSKIEKEPDFTTMRNILDEMARLNLSLDTKKKIPDILVNFFTYLDTNGKVPNAQVYVNLLHQASSGYEERFRDDGSVRGTTFKKNYTDVGRNEPCPCGSGKKFKKCCMKLLSQ